MPDRRAFLRLTLTLATASAAEPQKVSKSGIPYRPDGDDAVLRNKKSCRRRKGPVLLRKLELTLRDYWEMESMLLRLTAVLLWIAATDEYDRQAIVCVLAM